MYRFCCNPLESAACKWLLAIIFAGVFFWSNPVCLDAGEKNDAPFTLGTVAKIAEQLAAKSYQPPDHQAPKFLLNMSYDQWRDIRFNTEKSLWRSEKLPFEVQFFHLGCFYNMPVDINVIDGGRTKRYLFSPSLFDYGQNKFTGKIPDGLGFAGLRYHYNINRPDYKDEVAVFLGASYFRAIGKNMQYGLSARGLAIDCGLDTGEEFPVFKTFWLVKPASDATEAVVYALLDSKSCSGAYKFVIHPDEQTVMSVECRIFQRKPVKKLGIAPLTSMFFYGENNNVRPHDDFRPEVHDSDGLLLNLSTGEWIWQPLQNPKSLSLSIFQADNPAGFGLLQRDIDFGHYQDLEARYDNRPSAWIVPTGGDWKKGHVELVLIPSDSEVNDNIVSFWVPEIPPDKRSLTFSYDLGWHFPRKSPHGGGYVIGTRTVADPKKGTRTFLIDFQGGMLDQVGPDTIPDDVVTVTGKASIIEHRVQYNPFIKGWRLVFKVRTGQNPLEVLTNQSEPINLRAFLRRDKDVLTETWAYSIIP